LRNIIERTGKTVSWRIWWGFCSVLLLNGCQSAAPETCQLAFATDLKLTYRYGHALTTAMLNGAPTTLILDTGAQLTTLTRGAADRMALPLELLPGEASGIGGSARVYRYRSRSFQIGRLAGKDLPLMVTDMGLLGGRNRLDGLLGADFLAAYELDLDFGAHVVRLFKVENGCTKPATLLEEPLFVAPLVRSDSPLDVRPMVVVKIGDTSLKALIDTGADQTTIFRNAARRLGLRLEDLTTDMQIRERGVGPRTRLAFRHVMEALTIGEVTISKLPVAIVDEHSYDDTDMLLGLDFLSRVHVWLSFASQTMVMQYPPRPSPAFGQ
jgi:clan AA aspartic protease (TIGR02281 family)